MIDKVSSPYQFIKDTRKRLRTDVNSSKIHFFLRELRNEGHITLDEESLTMFMDYGRSIMCKEIIDLTEKFMKLPE